MTSAAPGNGIHPVPPAESAAHPGAEAAARVRGDLEKWLDAFSAAAGRLHLRDDPEAVHDVRVAVRRLIAGLRLWRPALGTRKRRRRAIQALRRWRRRLGEVRELEVHRALLEERQGLLGEEARAVLDAVLADLEGRERERRDRAIARLDARRLGRVTRRVRRAIDDLVPASLADPATREALLARIDRRRRNAESAIRRALQATEGDVEREDALAHAARIAVKRWRYAVERHRAVFPGTPAADLDALRGLQDVLGTAHDRATLLEELERNRWSGETPRPASDPLEPLLEGLDQERVEALARFRAACKELGAASPRA